MPISQLIETFLWQNLKISFEMKNTGFILYPFITCIKDCADISKKQKINLKSYTTCLEYASDKSKSFFFENFDEELKKYNISKLDFRRKKSLVELLKKIKYPLQDSFDLPDVILSPFYVK